MDATKQGEKAMTNFDEQREMIRTRIEDELRKAGHIVGEREGHAIHVDGLAMGIYIFHHSSSTKEDGSVSYEFAVQVLRRCTLNQRRSVFKGTVSSINYKRIAKRIEGLLIAIQENRRIAAEMEVKRNQVREMLSSIETENGLDEVPEIEIGDFSDIEGAVDVNVRLRGIPENEVRNIVRIFAEEIRKLSVRSARRV